MQKNTIKNTNKMTVDSKILLRRSLDVFYEAKKEDRPPMIEHVKRELRKHEKGLELIGMGCSEDTVTAARVFLRIVD